ncbi:MAG: hypothetical protein WD042_06705 [Phycisphaeraceae bacterium]
MVISHHLMWTLYGWWLPNDPRGSTSHVIRNDLLRDLGELHFGRKKIQPAGRDIRSFYEQAAQRLKHDQLAFAPDQFPIVAEAFADAIRGCRYTCYALAIMPDHVHLIIRKHRDLAETMIDNLQEQTRLRLIDAGLRTADHPTWTHGGWKVFLDTPDDIWRTIRYIEQNPVKIGLPVQHWPCVIPYNNWPFHKHR